MYYVYILSSLLDPHRKYVGFTQDVNNRLAEHNAGKCIHTAKFILWKLSTALLFDNKDKAIDFEKYLESGSGRAFSKRHL